MPPPKKTSGCVKLDFNTFKIKCSLSPNEKLPQTNSSSSFFKFQFQGSCFQEQFDTMEMSFFSRNVKSGFTFIIAGIWILWPMKHHIYILQTLLGAAEKSSCSRFMSGPTFSFNGSTGKNRGASISFQSQEHMCTK